MAMTPGWKLGKWLVICDRCGFKRVNTEVRKDYNGFMVCADTCWETRHPQEFVRSREDNQKVPFTRPKQTDQFTDVTYADTDADAIPAGTFNTTDTIGS